MVELAIPAGALVVLVGPAGAGKSTLAARLFAPTQVVSSDACRAMVADDEADMDATPAAFRVLHRIVLERLRAGRLTVVDATNVTARARQPLLRAAARCGRPAVAVVLHLPLESCLGRNRLRPGRMVPEEAVRRQHGALERSLPGLSHEGFAAVHLLDPASLEGPLHPAAGALP